MHPSRRLVLAAMAAALPAAAVLAQGPPGGGGFNFSAFQKWRDQHKYTFQLRTMVTGGIAECERSKATELKPAQAKGLLTVLNPLKTKPKLTQDEAKGAIQKVQKVFDSKQLSAVDRSVQASQRRSGPGGGGPPGGGGAGRPPGGGGPPGGGAGRPPGGGPPGGGGRPAFDFTKAKNFNPFNPDKTSPMYSRQKERNDKLFAFLAARAAGKAAKFDMPSFGRGPGGPGAAGPPGVLPKPK